MVGPAGTTGVDGVTSPGGVDGVAGDAGVVGTVGMLVDSGVVLRPAEPPTPTIGDVGTPVIAGARVVPAAPNGGDGMLLPGVTTAEPPNADPASGLPGVAELVGASSTTSPPEVLLTTPAAESRAAVDAPPLAVL